MIKMLKIQNGGRPPSCEQFLAIGAYLSEYLSN